jgi:hypothetical protein
LVKSMLKRATKENILANESQQERCPKEIPSIFKFNNSYEGNNTKSEPNP